MTDLPMKTDILLRRGQLGAISRHGHAASWVVAFSFKPSLATL